MADLVFNPLSGGAGVVVSGKDGVGGTVNVNLQAVTLRNEDGTAASFGGTGGGAQQVQGTTAVGVVPTTNPVGVSGTDQNGQTRSLRTNPNGDLSVIGNIGSGGVDSGNPVKVAGKYNATAPTLSDGQRGDVQIDMRGNLLIACSIYWTESTTALGSNATFNGTLRSNGGSAGSAGSRFGFFVGEAFSDVVGGTLFVDKSVDGGTTWRQVGSVAHVANTTVSLKVPVSAASYRIRVVNGATAQGAALFTSAYSLT